MQLHLTSRNPDVPKRMRLAVRSSPGRMMVFSERTGKVKLEGGVEVTCDVKPFDNAEYRKLLMRRHKKACVKTAIIKRMVPGGLNDR